MGRMYSEDNSSPVTGGAVFVAFIIVVFVVSALLVGCPHYNVYQQELAGKAKLREAESSRQILVQEAQAKKDSAKLLAEAEVERAKGVSEANRIIGEGLHGKHEYLMYLWIHALSENNNEKYIYVPTEGGLPILEASRFNNPVKEQK